MADASTIVDAIVSDAAGPLKVTGDVGSVEQYPLTDKIEAARFVAGQNAVNGPNRGIRFNKIIPPGAC